jgi:LacI family transcriptional regulator
MHFLLTITSLIQKIDNNLTVEEPDKKITINDIAQLAGVSIGTVDRVIHDRGEVSENTKDKILKIIKNLNYQPDIFASKLASKKNFKIAIVMPEVDNESSFWKAPNYGIDKAISELGFFGVVQSKYLYSLLSKDSFLENAYEALNDKPDILLLAPSFHNEAMDIVLASKAKGVPFLFFNSNLPSQGQICYVGQDARQSGKVAAKLIDYGIKSKSEILIVSIFSFLKNNKHILDRKQGFFQYFETKNDKDINLIDIEIDSLDVGYIYKVLHETFNANPSISGIFVTNSRVFHVARFIETEKLSNINLIGFDLTEENIPYLEKGIINFLINQKPVEQAYRAILTAFNKIILKKEVPEEILLPIDIVTKENLKYSE